jgi:7-cyano-7-deazaguanine synthase
MSRAVVLLSAGLDSSYNLFRANRELDVVLALTFNYGQKAAKKEIARAKTLCERLAIPHQVVELPWFKDFTKTSLVGSQKIPTGKDISIDDMERSNETKKAVWVPNRNGILLNIAAGFAEGLNAEFVIPGFNIEEAATFPDNSQDYMNALDRGFSFSTQNHVRVKCFSTTMNKTQIVKEAVKLEVPLKDLWPCYFANDQWCGECESCQRFSRAVREAGVKL